MYPTASGGVLHGEPLPADCYKVSLDLIFEGCGDYSVPYPPEDMPELHRNRGAFLKWPRHLVQLPDQVSFFSLPHGPLQTRDH